MENSLIKKETKYKDWLNIDSIKKTLLKYNIFFIFIIMLVASNFVSSSFLSETNIFNLLRQVSALGIISMGMLLVILTGGIDLSVGSIMAFASVLSAYFMAFRSMGFTGSLVLTILVSALLGGVAGYLVAFRNMAAFVATLALMTIARGLAYIVSKGTPIMVEDKILDSIANGYILGIPASVYLMLGIFIIVTLLLKYSVFGRMLIAIGSNEEVVRLSGIRVPVYKFSVYCISGALCAIAGIISTSRTGVGSPLVGTGYELDAIAAVVIGGASLTGGKGLSFNTLIGVFVLGIIGNIMNLLNVAAYPQQVIKGIIIVIAVLAQGKDSQKKV